VDSSPLYIGGRAIHSPGLRRPSKGAPSDQGVVTWVVVHPPASLPRRVLSHQESAGETQGPGTLPPGGSLREEVGVPVGGCRGCPGGSLGSLVLEPRAGSRSGRPARGPPPPGPLPLSKPGGPCCPQRPLWPPSRRGPLRTPGPPPAPLRGPSSRSSSPSRCWRHGPRLPGSRPPAGVEPLAPWCLEAPGCLPGTLPAAGHPRHPQQPTTTGCGPLSAPLQVGVRWDLRPRVTRLWTPHSGRFRLICSMNLAFEQAFKPPEWEAKVCEFPKETSGC
jgi:hypothetical protein